MTKDERYKIEHEYCHTHVCGKCPFSLVNNGYFIPCSMLKDKQFEKAYKRERSKEE